MDESEPVPIHLGFIKDGNRRWARAQGLAASAGHAAGYQALHEVLEACFERGVQYVSIFSFSSENWKRDKKEVASLMLLLMQAVAKDIPKLLRQHIRIRFLGSREGLAQKVITAIEKAESTTRDQTGGTLFVCFNYGGQQEIADAARRCVADGLRPEEVDEAAIAQRLYAPDAPPIDMVVRTSGEQRLSNFMLWQSAYSELLFLEKAWPEMTKADVAAIIEEYKRRSRRFGG